VAFDSAKRFMVSPSQFVQCLPVSPLPSQYRITSQLWLDGNTVLSLSEFFVGNNISSTLSECEFTPDAGISISGGRLQVNVADVPAAPIGAHFADMTSFIHAAQMRGGFILLRGFVCWFGCFYDL
jgi:hypothetical protein